MRGDGCIICVDSCTHVKYESDAWGLGVMELTLPLCYKHLKEISLHQISEAVTTYIREQVKQYEGKHTV